jgi:hypothetical protein
MMYQAKTREGELWRRMMWRRLMCLTKMREGFTVNGDVLGVDSIPRVTHIEKKLNIQNPNN